jgi:hypothetical protein
MSNRSEKVEGGRRKSRRHGKKGAKTVKKGKGPSEWNKKVMEIYRKMKKSNPSVKLGAAMKEASRLKKKGQL